MAYENFPARLSCPGARAINRLRRAMGAPTIYIFILLYTQVMYR